MRSHRRDRRRAGRGRRPGPREASPALVQHRALRRHGAGGGNPLPAGGGRDRVAGGHGRGHPPEERPRVGSGGDAPPLPRGAAPRRVAGRLGGRGPRLRPRLQVPGAHRVPHARAPEPDRRGPVGGPPARGGGAPARGARRGRGGDRPDRGRRRRGARRGGRARRSRRADRRAQGDPGRERVRRQPGDARALLPGDGRRVLLRRRGQHGRGHPVGPGARRRGRLHGRLPGARVGRGAARHPHHLRGDHRGRHPGQPGRPPLRRRDHGLLRARAPGARPAGGPRVERVRRATPPARARVRGLPASAGRGGHRRGGDRRRPGGRARASRARGSPTRSPSTAPRPRRGGPTRSAGEIAAGWSPRFAA